MRCRGRTGGGARVWQRGPDRPRSVGLARSGRSLRSCTRRAAPVQRGSGAVPDVQRERSRRSARAGLAKASWRVDVCTSRGCASTPGVRQGRCYQVRGSRGWPGSGWPGSGWLGSGWPGNADVREDLGESDNEVEEALRQARRRRYWNRCFRNRNLDRAQLVRARHHQHSRQGGTWCRVHGGLCCQS